MREAAPRTECKDHLHNLGIALHNYHEVNGCFPPAIVRDATGKPLYSWRVLILPYIENEEQYAKFRLNEPWNSPHNLEVARDMSGLFHCPAANAVDSEGVPHTRYLAVLGPSRGFRVQGVRTLDQLNNEDGSSHTQLIAEISGDGVPWTAPFDTTQAELKTDCDHGECRHGRHQVLMADGSVRGAEEALEPLAER